VNEGGKIAAVPRRQTKIPDAALEYFRREGARGGKLAAANATAAERQARARKAGQASGAARAKKKKQQKKTG